jgi:asparagine synthase (glutamine-hydrolysing)
MCGITGYLAASGSLDPEERTVAAMMAAIAHRGPDSRGHWTDPAAGIALGHLRLAIVDLTPAGAQPMVSASGRRVMTYNGEIYNHAELRRDLEAAGRAPAWRGTSDTETLLAGIEAWGLDATLTRARGMFALALWDRQERTLSLARDRAGEKPLYYGWQGRGEAASFLFGSELRALAAHPACEQQIDRDALPGFLRHGNFGEGNSVWKGISKLLPGEIAELSLAARTPSRRRYWDGAAVAAEARRSAAPPDDATAVDRLEALLLDAVGSQMMSDVPLGAFLSGGIDSSTIVALMQRQSSLPVRTYTIGFREARYNEAEHAARVAAHLGTRHTELYVDDPELLDVVPRLPELFDEPFSDSSQIPTYLVSRLARSEVTVALSGDGGDELFAGYDRYRQGAALMARLRHLPRPLSALAASAVQAVPPRLLDGVVEPFRPTPQGKEPNGQRLHRLADYARSRSLDELHRKLVSVWRFPDAAVPGARPPVSLLAEGPPRGTLSDVERMMQLDLVSYLPDDILTKVDRATMAVALESRAPLLDPRVIEFAWQLPLSMKLRDGKSKWLLRQVLYRHVPAALIERPKMGFEVPIGLWLRGPLRDWAAALLDPARLAGAGLFDAQLIAGMWRQHLSGARNWGPQLWAVLMFEAWRAAQGSALRAAA